MTAVSYEAAVIAKAALSFKNLKSPSCIALTHNVVTISRFGVGHKMAAAGSAGSHHYVHVSKTDARPAPVPTSESPQRLLGQPLNRRTDCELPSDDTVTRHVGD